MTDALEPTTESRPQSFRYWTEIIDAAFILWFENNQDEHAVVKILHEDPMWREIAMIEDDDQIPQAQTIRRWVKKYWWKERAADKMRELSPLRIQAAALELAYGSEDAAKSTMRIAKGHNVTREDRTVLEAAKFVLQSTLGDSIVSVVKPAVTQSIEIESLDTMEQIVEAEQKLRELDE